MSESMSETNQEASGSPAARYRAELEDERRRREELEQKVSELAAENRRSRREAAAKEQSGRIRDALQAHGVQKTELAERIVREDVRSSESGELYGMLHGERLPLDEYLGRFLSENPELMPPRIAGGSGIPAGDRNVFAGSGVELDSIRPGMDSDEAKAAWQEVARLMGTS